MEISVQFFTPILLSLEQSSIEVCSNEVEILLKKVVIKRVVDDGLGFVSSIFTIKQAKGGVHPIVNLKYLNSFLVYEHFKMEGMESVKFLLSQGDFLAKLDLRDAYLVVPIWDDDRGFLRFVSQGNYYEFMAMPFGLASALRSFTNLLKPVMEVLRKQGFRVVIYLDDMLFMHEDLVQLAASVKVAVDRVVRYPH